jgi:hypothetical protein
VFSFLLFIVCFFILIPYAVGILVSLVLRELYKRQLWEKSIAEEQNDKEIEEEISQEDMAVKLYDPSLDEINSEKTLDTETDAKQIQGEESISAKPMITALDSELNTEPLLPSAVSENSATSEIPVIPETLATPVISGISETISESEQSLSPDESQSENKLPSVFDDQNVILPDTFKVNDILDEMVNENPPIIPADLSLRLEEDGTPESRINQMKNENEQDLLEPDENEILTKITAAADSKNQPFSQPEMMFNNFDNEGENTNTVHSEIAPLAIELLGEDFNFNSFFDEKSKSKQKNKEPITVSEIGQGIYQADGGFLTITNDQTLRNLLPKEQEIVSLYPDHLVQNAVAEPDSSEVAQNFSFTEELLPMLVRKKNKK